MRLAFILKDIGLNEIDMSNPQNGNPGIGGSEYLFVLLMYYLSIQSKYEIICYHFGNNKLPKGIVEIGIDKVNDALIDAKDKHVDFLIYQINWGEEFYNKLNEIGVNAIAWAHCYISKEELRMMTSSCHVNRVVCVGKEQYDTYIDHPIIKKMTYIYNMVPSNRKEKRIVNDNIVTYVGSLVEGKGFHILAKAWPKVISKVPNAKLYVIGTGKLYDRTSKLGLYGIAEKSYEKKFIKYLLDKNGSILESVNFLGILGEEKKDIFEKTKVGVINPSAKTETFGMSAVEMALYGIPIVTRGAYGLFDTVIDRKTGLLHSIESSFSKNIVKLLLDNNLNEKLGVGGKEFAAKNFAPETIISNWNALFEELQNGTKLDYLPAKNHFTNDLKWARIINRFLRVNLGLRLLPPICEIKRTY